MSRLLFLIKVSHQRSIAERASWQIPIIVEVTEITEETVAFALNRACNNARIKVSENEKMLEHWTEQLWAEALGAPTVCP